MVAGIHFKAGDRLTVLDVSLEKNSSAIKNALANQVEVFYVDHHYPGAIPVSANFTSIINESPDVCTSLLVNGYLQGAYSQWAVVGAFGDNLKKSALALAKNLNLSTSDLQRLEALGIYINYNGYGSSIEDLHFNPVDLYRKLSAYSAPLDFVSSCKADFQKLEEGYNSDMLAAKNTKATVVDADIAVFILPNEPWARRVSGVYSNDLTNAFPDRAHGVLTIKENGNYLVSVRAPLNNKQGAVDLCRNFPTGGGRAAAAGINDLPADRLNYFIDKLRAGYS